jgi:hypothetical protein
VNDIATPMLEKSRLAREVGRSHEIGAFLDWMSGQGIHRMRWVPDEEAADNDYEGYWVADSRTIERLLADYFEIDLAAVETEKRLILDALRAQHEQAR